MTAHEIVVYVGIALNSVAIAFLARSINSLQSLNDSLGPDLHKEPQQEGHKMPCDSPKGAQARSRVINDGMVYKTTCCGISFHGLNHSPEFGGACRHCGGSYGHIFDDGGTWKPNK